MTTGQSLNTGSQTAPSGNKMAGNATVDEKLAESVRKFQILYDKSSKKISKTDNPCSYEYEDNCTFIKRD